MLPYNRTPDNDGCLHALQGNSVNVPFNVMPFMNPEFQLRPQMAPAQRALPDEEPAPPKKRRRNSRAQADAEPKAEPGPMPVPMMKSPFSSAHGFLNPDLVAMANLAEDSHPVMYNGMPWPLPTSQANNFAPYNFVNGQFNLPLIPKLSPVQMMSPMAFNQLHHQLLAGTSPESAKTSMDMLTLSNYYQSIAALANTAYMPPARPIYSKVDDDIYIMNTPVSNPQLRRNLTLGLDTSSTISAFKVPKAEPYYDESAYGKSAPHLQMQSLQKVDVKPGKKAAAAVAKPKRAHRATKAQQKQKTSFSIQTLVDVDRPSTSKVVPVAIVPDAVAPAAPEPAQVANKVNELPPLELLIRNHQREQIIGEYSNALKNMADGAAKESKMQIMELLCKQSAIKYEIDKYLYRIMEVEVEKGTPGDEVEKTLTETVLNKLFNETGTYFDLYIDKLAATLGLRPTYQEKMKFGEHLEKELDLINSIASQSSTENSFFANDPALAQRPNPEVHKVPHPPEALQELQPKDEVGKPTTESNVQPTNATRPVFPVATVTKLPGPQTMQSAEEPPPVGEKSIKEFLKPKHFYIAEVTGLQLRRIINPDSDEARSADKCQCTMYKVIHLGAKKNATPKVYLFEDAHRRWIPPDVGPFKAKKIVEVALSSVVLNFCKQVELPFSPVYYECFPTLKELVQEKGEALTIGDVKEELIKQIDSGRFATIDDMIVAPKNKEELMKKGEIAVAAMPFRLYDCAIRQFVSVLLVGYLPKSADPDDLIKELCKFIITRTYVYLRHVHPILRYVVHFFPEVRNWLNHIGITKDGYEIQFRYFVGCLRRQSLLEQRRKFVNVGDDVELQPSGSSNDLEYTTDEDIAIIPDTCAEPLLE